MTGELWWRRLVNSARFLDDLKDTLADDRSVVLIFDTDIPWLEIMTGTIEQKLADANDNRTFDIHNVSKVDSPGDYLKERYCSKEEQKKYWPTTHGSPEKFLAQNKVTPLNKRYVCLMGIKTENASKWTASIAEYLENCDDVHKHGVFIIILEGMNVPVSKHLTAFRYDDYITDYDCMMLCLTLVSDLKCNRAEKMYLCETASNIAHNNVELAAMLVSRRTALIQEPYKVSAEVFEENEIKVTNLKERVRMAVWEAQIKLVFPKIENFRADLIRKYENKISRYLPIRSSNNDVVDKASDLEIGQLYFICKANCSQKVIDLSEYEMLKKMRDVRNTLAHWEALSYEQLIGINVI
ncbi:MAG: hypothetical protein K2J71_03425 [Oscillospiraceae bacterium]|nr:hypothetical protein [Oscillospiraceae bacterium]